MIVYALLSLKMEFALYRVCLSAGPARKHSPGKYTVCDSIARSSCGGVGFQGAKTHSRSLLFSCSYSCVRRCFAGQGDLPEAGGSAVWRNQHRTVCSCHLPSDTRNGIYIRLTRNCCCPRFSYYQIFHTHTHTHTHYLSFSRESVAHIHHI